MNYLAGIAAFTVSLAIGITAFADSTATYTNTGDNTVNVTETGTYQTVMITKANDPTNIVYLNQTDSNDLFASSAAFMLKEDASYGKYKVMLGNADGGTGSVDFYIGIDQPKTTDIAMTRVGEELRSGLYSVGYKAELTAEEYNDASAIKVVYKDGTATKTGGYNLKDGVDYPEMSGVGGINLLFQINGVDSAYQDSITVFLSKDELTDTKLSEQQGGE